MRSVTLCAALLAALVATPAPAQERGFPYALSQSDWGIVGAGLGLTLLGEALEDTPRITEGDLTGLGPGDVNGFDRQAARWWSPTWDDRSDLSRDGLLAAAGVAAFAPVALQGQWRNGATLGVMFLETYLVLGGATRTVKRLADRRRPYLYNDDLSAGERVALANADDDGPTESFFSGHSAAAFAAAALLSTIVEDVHGPSTAVRVLQASSFAVAGFTAFARVRAGKHYPSDVLVGALVGTGVGILIPWMHRAREPGGASVSVSPAGVVVRIPWAGN